MPRWRNLYDYSTEDKHNRPKETLCDVSNNDSVQLITIEFESQEFAKPNYVQIKRVNGTGDWQVTTTFPLAITKDRK